MPYQKHAVLLLEHQIARLLAIVISEPPPPGHDRHFTASKAKSCQKY